jgi:hypothetical protein
MGTASTRYPRAAGTTMTAVHRIPRARSSRKARRSPSTHRDDMAGRSAVNTDTTKMACGSWNRMNADAYAVYPPFTRAARIRTTRYPSWFATT